MGPPVIAGGSAREGVSQSLTPKPHTSDNQLYHAIHSPTVSDHTQGHERERIMLLARVPALNGARVLAIFSIVSIL
jgi:hypothetical protein